MDKICPNCQTEYDESHGFCSCCGARLIDKIDEIDPLINFGDANAINGGVNINRSKNITSHDTHYHSTTIHERAKSDAELKLDAINQLRNRAQEIMSQRGRIDSIAINELKPFSISLGIDDISFRNVIKEIRTVSSVSDELSITNARYLQQAQQAIQTNNIIELSALIPRLEAITSITTDDNAQYIYYLSLAIFGPSKIIEIYKNQTEENYWRTFFTIVSYIRNNNLLQAEILLAKFNPGRFEKSEDDLALLEAYSNVMKGDVNAGKVFLEEILGEPSKQLISFYRAIECIVYDEEPNKLDVEFYIERFFDRSMMTKEEMKYKTIESAHSIEETSKKQNYNFSSLSTEESNINTLLKEETDDVQLLVKAAEFGDASAQAKLASKYYGEKDFNKAFLFAQKAAEKGEPLAYRVLGDCFFKGLSVCQNYTEAFKCYSISAEKGDADSQCNLGNMYCTGSGVGQNYVEAVKWFKKSAEQGNDRGQSNLGLMYNVGRGVDQNYTEAVAWFRKSAEQGNAIAQCNLGSMYESGKGVSQNYIEAVKWYKKSAEQGNAVAQCNLGIMYEYGKGVEQNYGEAAAWYKKSSEQGNETAMMKLAKSWIKGVIFGK